MVIQRGSPRATSYFHISDNLYIKFDNNDKKGNLGNQWQSLISSHHFNSVVELVYLEVNTSAVVCVENCKNLVDENFCFPFRQHSCVPDQQFQQRQKDAAEL